MEDDEGKEGEEYNTIQFRLMAQKTPQLTQTQLRITREKS